MRKRIRYFDMEKIERSSEPLTVVEKEVRDRLTHDPRGHIYTSIDLGSAMETLSPRQKECFDLMVMEGFTERFTARKLGISKGSVQEHVRCAREKLRKYLYPASSRAN